MPIVIFLGTICILKCDIYTYVLTNLLQVFAKYFVYCPVFSIALCFLKEVYTVCRRKKKTDFCVLVSTLPFEADHCFPTCMFHLI